MKEMVICKACGFIMEKGKLREVCPACGVKAAMFQPHDERISARRKLLLGLDLHPVMVHFPQAFATTVLFLSFVTPFVHGAFGGAVRSTILVLGLLLPVVVLAAFFAGIFDAKIRFRRVSAPLLKRKIFLGVLLFIISGGVAVFSWFAPHASTSTLFLTGALSAAAIGVEAVLGLIGVSLLHARFPG
jgi:hypothetical protein